MKKFLTILFICIFGISYAQEEPQLRILSKANSDNIELRWIPTNFQVWKYANLNGYKLERITIIRKKKQVFPPEIKVLNSQPIKLADISEFEKYEEEKYPSIYAECVYGESDEKITTLSPKAIYKQYQQNQMKLGLALASCDLDKKTAKLAGLYYKDADVNIDEKYVYRLTFFTPDSIYCDTATTFTGLSEFSGKVFGPKPELNYTDSVVTLYFNTDIYKHFNSFFIEKSSDNGNTFSRVNEEPYAKSLQNPKSSTFYFSDTLVTENQNYIYRVIGIDSFGDLSEPGEPTAMVTIPKLENFADFSSCKTINNNSVQVNWFISDNDKDKVTGFKIYRSKSPEGSKSIIYETSNKNERSYIDKSAGYDNYYFISAFTPYEEKFNPFPIYAMLIDSVPPAKPQKPNGICDSLGHVFLSWYNTDNDVVGYRIYSANNPNYEFTPVSKGMLADTFYVDTVDLNSITNNIFYKIKAVDGRDNQSEFSDYAEVRRYDTIPPLKPKFKDFDFNKHKLKINWIASGSNDVVKYIIFRKKASDQCFDTLTVVDNNVLTYIDEVVADGTDYFYGVVAVDDFGNQSEMGKKAFLTPNSKDNSVSLKKTLNVDVLTLNWSSKVDKPIKNILLYKANENGILRSYKYVSGSSYSEKLLIGQKLTFCIRIIYQDGTESPLSNEIKIEI